MKILITNHHLVSYGGTEVYTFKLARALKLLGHDVCVYTKYLGKLEKDLDRIFVPVSTNIKDYSAVSFDIAHVHHNITAFEVRSQFPNLPMFFLSHGFQPFLEQPPFIDLNITQFGAVSEKVRTNLIAKGVTPSKIDLIYNIVNEDLFYPNGTISEIPRQALVLSTKLPEEIHINIQKACADLNINVNYVGGRFGDIHNANLPNYINRADIIFTLGRGVMESMLCGRVPIVLDRPGFDGMVIPSNFEALLSANFSGKVLQILPSIENISHEIKKYKPAYGMNLRDLALDRFSSKIVCLKLLKTYLRTIKMYKKNKEINLELVENIVKSIEANNFFGYFSIYPLHSKIVHSKFYKVWRIMQKLKSFK